ncbi:MAG: TonB-dependent receptor [Bacteroidota bacterium]
MNRNWPIILFLAITFQLNGQSFLDQQVSISCENLLLEKALVQLISESDIPLSYSNSIIPAGHYVNVVFVDEPLKIVLDSLLAGTNLRYEISGSQIILTKKNLLNEIKYTLRGFVRDAEDGENLIGAVIYSKELNIGTYTNEFGFFSLTFPATQTDITVSYTGYESQEVPVDHFQNRQMDFELGRAWLRPVLVNFFSDSSSFIQGPNSYDINVPLTNRMASFGGEADPIRTASTLPGIQTGADGFGGLAVRGGDIDQNLFMLDGVPIYNAMHGIGLFSIYNSSAIRSAKILKGSFPARYGGRMSSVWDVQTKEGNKKEMLGEFDIGVTSAKLTLEGPIVKNKGSFFFSGRRSLFDFYSEPISRKLRDNGGSVTYNFDDLNLKFNYELSEKDRLFLSFYTGSDTYNDLRILQRSVSDTISRFSDSEIVEWGNKIAALRWNHIFSEKVFGNTTLTYSSYRYASEDFIDLFAGTTSGILMDTLSRDVILQLYSSEIRDFSAKTDFDYAKFDKHKIKFGGQFTRHRFDAKVATFEDAPRIDEINRDTVGDFFSEALFSNELEFYLEDEVEFNNRLQANIGIRVSSSHVLDKWFILPQPRLLLTYKLDNETSFDASVTRMTQFLHLLSPSRLGLPKDLWVTSTNRVPPQDSWQFALGASKKLRKGFRIDIDLFYKRLYNQLFFNGPIANISTINWQDQVSIGKGRSYGAELLLERQGRKWSGWLSYTLSWSNRRFPDDINDGESFPIKLDRRHNLNIQGLFDLNKKWDLAAGFVIASGSFYNLPTREFIVAPFDGVPTSIEPIKVPEGINDRRLAPYHRLDFSANYYFSSKSFDHTLKFGVTNLYNRLNPLFRTLRDKYDENGNLSDEFVEVSLLPIFPTLRYSVILN